MCSCEHVSDISDLLKSSKFIDHVNNYKLSNFQRESCIYFVLGLTSAQLFHKLSHSYMFRHYHVILRELVIGTLAGYTSISHVAVGNITNSYM